LGIVLLILGIVALLDSVLATALSVIFFGWVLVIAGIVETSQTFRHRRSGHLSLHPPNAVLSIVVGIMLLLSPLAGVLVLTLLPSVYFTVADVFRMVTALNLRLPGWGWALFNDTVTLILGILLRMHWPATGLWVIGLFIGIGLLVVGCSQIMPAIAVRTLSKAQGG
jgi:uncharacterized membrane protein HdeD (DUF308 family)